MPSFESRYAAYCDALDANSQRRRLLPSREPVAGQTLLADFSHNDYLGLAHDPAALEAALAAGRMHGVGATGSRLLSGNLAPHVELEAAIAAAKGTEAALVFNSGFQANASALAALLDTAALGAEPLVFSDRLNHASLHHACQLMNVRQVRYRHNDMTHLRSLLETHRSDPRPRFIVAETVFGMDGDQVNMAALTALAAEFDALLYLDEAHATGVFGETGYGLASGWMQRDGRSLGVAMGTFSKALGVAGAYVACSQAVRDYLLNRCGGFIYSTAPSPLVIGAALHHWQRLPQMAEQRTALQEKARTLRERLHILGFDTGASSTHIVPIIVGAAQTAIDLKQWLLDRGILVSAIRPPTVPPHGARIRIALSATHSTAQIDTLMAALTAWKQQAL
ncbi:MAG: 8-amino-7-oxononanoate synthase [Proteobacteria bacterium]|nr:8-amino-7-oxononanoate synthase [Pseudomonadota bacterium]